jgi:hypothetical protein
LFSLQNRSVIAAVQPLYIQPQGQAVSWLGDILTVSRGTADWGSHPALRVSRGSPESSHPRCRARVSKGAGHPDTIQCLRNCSRRSRSKQMDSHELRGDQADTHRIVTPDLWSSQSLDRAALLRKHCNAERLVAASLHTGHFASGMVLSSEQAWFR